MNRSKKIPLELNSLISGVTCGQFFGPFSFRLFPSEVLVAPLVPLNSIDIFEILPEFSFLVLLLYALTARSALLTCFVQ